jgi:hypothetical protein
MKNRIQASIIFLSLASLVLGSCRKEKIKPEQANSFIKYYGKGGTQKAGNVALTPDGGYILVGTTDSYGNGKDILVVKTDQFGNEQWSKVLGGAGDDEGQYVLVTKSGDYVIAGSKTDVSNSKTNASLIKMNAGGSILFDSLYGDKNYNEKFNKVQETLDGGFIAVGQTDKVNPTKPEGTSTDDKLDMLLLKTNTNGLKDWDVVIGIKYSDIGTAVQQYDDDEFATTATSTSSTNSDIQITRGRIQIVNNKADYTAVANQNKSSLNKDVLTAVDLIYETGNAFYITGSTGNNEEIYLLKLDNNGVQVSDGFVTFGTSGKDIASAFQRTADGGFIITGSTTATSSNDETTDVLLIKTDAAGKPIWIKQFGGTGNDTGIGVQITSDGGYIVSASIAFGGNATGANTIMSLIHVDSNGELK